MFYSIWLMCAAVACAVRHVLTRETELTECPMGYEAAWPTNHPNHPNQPE